MVMTFLKIFLLKMCLPKFLYIATILAAVYFVNPSLSGTVKRQAISPPVLFPAIRSQQFATLFPVRFSISSSTIAGISPLIPPPEIDNIIFKANPPITMDIILLSLSICAQFCLNTLPSSLNKKIKASAKLAFI